ncbi:glycosyltransferase family 25 protein [bacterium]|nr:glycosyltransferase family 25 protein [bacterium]
MYPFEKVICISLNRRPDRWQRFQAKLPSDWPLLAPERFAAVDGRRVTPAPWWTAGSAAWGCYQSHLQILRNCIEDKVDSVLILEDDAVCVDDFTSEAEIFFGQLPTDWELVYLGGQHLKQQLHPPVRVNDKVQIPYNVNRNHAYALKSRSAIKRVCRHLENRVQWQSGHHFDHHLGTLVEQRKFPVYSPTQWLIGQDEGHSNIAARHFNRRFFDAGPQSNLFLTDFIMVVGDDPQAAGQLAAELKREGVFTGTQFLQPLNEEDTAMCSGPSMELNAIFEKHFPKNSSLPTPWEGSLRCQLAEWLRYMTYTAKSLGTVAGGYAPHFNDLVPLMKSLLGDRLKVVSPRVGRSLINGNPAD